MISPFEFFWDEYAKYVYGTYTAKKINPKLHMTCKEIKPPEIDPTEDRYPCSQCKVITGKDELLDNSGCYTGCTNRLVNRHFDECCVFVRVFQGKSWEIQFKPALLLGSCSKLNFPYHSI